MNSKTVDRLERAGAVLLALVLWHLLSIILDNSIVLVSPLDVLLRLATIWQQEGFFATVWFSFFRISAGFLLALLAGIILGTLAGRFRLLEILLRPFVVTVQSVPVASVIIILLVWLSAGMLSAAVSFLIVFPIIYGNILTGFKERDYKLLEVSQVYGIRGLKKLRYITLPGLKSYLTAGCSSGLGLCWKAGIAAEVIGLPTGSVGSMLYNSKLYLNITDLFVWTLLIIVLSVGFEKLFLWLLKLFFRLTEEVKSK